MKPIVIALQAHNCQIWAYPPDCESGKPVTVFLCFDPLQHFDDFQKASIAGDQKQGVIF